MKNIIPYLLILFRFLLGPTLIFLCCKFGNSIRLELVFLIVLGLLSDIFDGIIARKLGVSSEQMRRLDSQVDLIFWLCVGFCCWILNRELIIENKFSISLVFAMEVLTYVFSFAKFGKETCTHAYLSKFWGLTLFATFVSIIGFGYAGFFFYLSLIVGIIAHLDVYLIILFLPKWTHDVPSCFHALKIKKGKEIIRNKWFNG